MIEQTSGSNLDLVRLLFIAIAVFVRNAGSLRRMVRENQLTVNDVCHGRRKPEKRNSLVKAAAQQGWIDEKQVVLKTLTSMKRAGQI